MAVKIEASYVSGKSVELFHEPSGARLITDAPIDNNGEGKSFSPTDLTASSLLSCIMTIMSIKAEQKGVSLHGMRGSVVKEMSTDPRRIGRLTVEIHLPQGLDQRERKVFEAVAATCPVHHSLHPDIEVSCAFFYDV